VVGSQDLRVKWWFVRAGKWCIERRDGVVICEGHGLVVEQVEWGWIGAMEAWLAMANSHMVL